MRTLFSSTRGRLAAASVLILAVALLVADAFLLGSLFLAARGQADSVLVSQANVLASGLQDVNGTPAFGGGQGDLPGETQAGIAVDAAIVGPTGVLASTPSQPLSIDELRRLAVQAASAPVWADLVDSRGAPRRVYARPLNQEGENAVLVVSRSVAEPFGTLAQTAAFLAVFTLAVLAAAGAVSYWLAGRALRPVRTIADLAQSISDRDLNRRVEVDVPADELGHLVRTFNSMLARLEAGFESLRRFTADASHELRTPLALMRNELDVSLQSNRRGAEYRATLQTLRGEVDHLGRLVDQLLLLARADAGALKPALETMDVADFLNETAARWSTAAEPKGVRIEVSAPDAGTVAGDPSLLRRVVDNLLDNALRHAPPNSVVSIEGRHGAQGWELDVSDEGPGVAPAQRDRLFSRFSRAEGPTGDGVGAGLGLALSAAIATAHGGELSLVPPDGAKGARFRLLLAERP